MQGSLLQLLNQTREKSISLRGHTVTMRLLTAYDMMLLHMEKREDTEVFSAALRGNASLLRACLCSEGEPIFQTAEEVLHTLSLEEINNLVEAYRMWSNEIDPSVCSKEEMVESLKKA